MSGDAFLEHHLLIILCRTCWKTVWCLSGTWLSFQKNKLTALHQVLLGISLYQIYPYLHFKLPKRNCHQRFKVDKARHLVMNQGTWLRGKKYPCNKRKTWSHNNNRNLLRYKLFCYTMARFFLPTEGDDNREVSMGLKLKKLDQRSTRSRKLSAQSQVMLKFRMPVQLEQVCFVSVHHLAV